MRLPSTGRYLSPKIEEDTLRSSTFESSDLSDIVSAATWTLPGATSPATQTSPTGQSLAFTAATDQAVSALTPDEVTAWDSNTWTLETLLRITAEPDPAEVEAILAVESTAGRYFSLGVEDRQLKWAWDGPLGVVFGEFTQPEILLGVWYKITFRYDGSELFLALNGRNARSVVPSAPPTGSTAGGSIILGDDGGSVLDGAAPRTSASFEIDYVYFEEGLQDASTLRDNQKRMYLMQHHTNVCLRTCIGVADPTLFDPDDDNIFTFDDPEPNFVWNDYSDFFGYDWVKSVSRARTLDAATTTVDIELFKEARFLSLSPLRNDSPTNLVDPNDPSTFGEIFAALGLNRPVKIDFARLPYGVAPQESDWETFYEGITEKIDFGKETIKISTADRAGVLNRAYIEEETKFAIGGAPVQVLGVMQAMIDQWSNINVTGGYAPLTITDPAGILVLVSPEYMQRRENVMAGLRTLASAFAGDVKYRWNHELGEYALMLHQPQRSKDYPNFVLGPDSILSVDAASVDLQDIRTAGRVVWPNYEPALTPPTSDTSRVYRLRQYGQTSEGQPLPATLDVEDTEGLLKYGRQFFEIVEAASSPIRTIEEATAMINAVLDDFSEPEFTHSVKTCFIPELEIDDMGALLPNRDVYSGEQLLAATAIRDTYSDSSSTKIDMRGKPTVSPKRWQALMAEPGKRKPPLVNPDQSLNDFEQTSISQPTRNLYDRSKNLNASRLKSNRNPDFQERSRGPSYPPDGWGTYPEPTLQLDLTNQDDVAGSSDNHYTNNFRTVKVGTGSGNGAVEWLTADGGLVSNLVQIGSENDQALGIEITYKSLGAGTSYPRIIVEYFAEDETLLGAALHNHYEGSHRGTGSDLVTTPVPSQISFTTGGPHSLTTGEYYDIFPYPSYGGPDTGNFFPSDVQLRKLLVDNAPPPGAGASVIANVPAFTTGLTGWGAPGGFLSMGWRRRPRFWDVDDGSPPTDFSTYRMLGVEWVDRDAHFVRVRVEHQGAFSGMVVDKLLIYELAHSMGAELHDRLHHLAHGIFIDPTPPAPPVPGPAVPPYAWTGLHASHPLVTPANNDTWQAFPFLNCGDEDVGFDFGDVFTEQGGLAVPLATYPQVGGHSTAKESGRYEVICVLNGAVGHGGDAYASLAAPAGIPNPQTNAGLQAVGIGRIRVVRASAASGVRTVIVEGNTTSCAGISEGYATNSAAGPWDLVANATGTVFLEEGDKLYGEVYFRSDWNDAGLNPAQSVLMTLYDKGRSYFNVSMRRVD